MAQDVLNIFISSKMLEFQAERQMLFDSIPNLLMGVVRLHAWVFEYDAPASQDPSRKIWLPELDTSVIYLGLLGKDYGEWTIDEFDRATERRIPKLIFIKKMVPTDREEKLIEFIKSISNSPITGINPEYFDDVEDLRQRVSRAIQNWVLKRLSNKSSYEIREALKERNRDYWEWFDSNQSLEDSAKDQSKHTKIIRKAIELCEDAEDIVDEDCRKCLEVDALSADWDSCYSKYRYNLTYIARKRLTPYFVTGHSASEGPPDKAGAQKMGIYYQRNLNALSDAIDRLKETI